MLLLGAADAVVLAADGCCHGQQDEDTLFSESLALDLKPQGR